MIDKRFNLRLITPEGIKVDDDVDMTIMRCTTGDMAVLHGHEPRSGALEDSGVLRIFKRGKELKLAVYGGLFRAQNNGLTLLTNAAELPEDIDLEQARRGRERAEERLREISDDDKEAVRRAQTSLRRSLVRIEVSSHPIVSRTYWEE